jgi:uncharacterized protein (UPF0248 family)|tara:strand:- start:7983 stop:8222 length:240 start_codon:yes stop_codon:yes gene_type:complete
MSTLFKKTAYVITEVESLNLPKEILSELKWKPDEDIEVLICVNHTCNKNDDRYFSISITREEDLKKYDDGYIPVSKTIE